MSRPVRSHADLLLTERLDEDELHDRADEQDGENDEDGESDRDGDGDPHLRRDRREVAVGGRGPVGGDAELDTVRADTGRADEQPDEREFQPPRTVDRTEKRRRRTVGVVDGLDLVVRWTSGTLATELRTVRNDLAWNHDFPAALLAFADRIHVPGLTRTVRLVADGSRASGDLHELLEVAATDTRARAKLRRTRRRAVGSYVAIVVIGFLVYLLVVTLLSRSYLAPLEALPELPETSATTGAPLSADVPVDAFELLFFHSALVQGFGSGLLAGKLAENDLKSGLKYGIGLVVITVVTFALFV